MAKNYNKGRTIGMNPNQPKNVNLNPDDLTDVVCEKCGCQVFEPAFLFKKLSAVLSPNGKQIAFSTFMHLYVADVKTGEHKRLTKRLSSISY